MFRTLSDYNIQKAKSYWEGNSLRLKLRNKWGDSTFKSASLPEISGHGPIWCSWYTPPFTLSSKVNGRWLGAWYKASGGRTVRPMPVCPQRSHRMKLRTHSINDECRQAIHWKGSLSLIGIEVLFLHDHEQETWKPHTCLIAKQIDCTLLHIARNAIHFPVNFYILLKCSNNMLQTL